MNGCDYCDGDGCGNCNIQVCLDITPMSQGEYQRLAGRLPERVRHDGEDHDVHEPDQGGEG